MTGLVQNAPGVALCVALLAGVLAGVAAVAALYLRRLRATKRIGYTDDVTGALNLPGFRREASRLLGKSKQYALLHTSIRAFQYFNDQYGYAEGDSILFRVAEIYRKNLRHDECFCRISGGTFAALLVGDPMDTLFARINALHEQAHLIVPSTDASYHLRMTSGVYLSEPGDTREVYSMLDRANAARRQISASTELYVNVYREGFYDVIMRQQAIESRMEAALDAGDFVIFLQPKVELASMRPVGAEALVRWHDEKYVLPGEFIANFERNGFILRLDRYVFTWCCKAMRRWIQEGRDVVPISINVSRAQLYADDFVEFYVAEKNRFGIADGLLEIEFTESFLFEDSSRLAQIVRQLRASGFACAIDDFGKGYSSMTMLKDIPVDSIKLDAQFFQPGVDARRDRIVVESVLGMVRMLGMRSVAEGIETLQQVELLQKTGCDVAQGFLFAKPLDIDAFEGYLQVAFRNGRVSFLPQDRS